MFYFLMDQLSGRNSNMRILHLHQQISAWITLEESL